MKQVIRWGARAGFAALIVSLVCLGSALAAPTSPAPALAFLCFAFAVLAVAGGRGAVLVGVAVGALELALLLPGEGFAIARPEDALGVIGTIAAGLTIAWQTGRADSWITELDRDARQARADRDRISAFFDEISHRVANDLAMLVSLASIRSREAIEPETRAALGDLSSRMIVLGRVYRRLRVRAADRQEMNARGFLEELCAELQQATLGLRPIALRLEIDPITLPLGQMVIVGLIVNELMTNVYKHAFPDDRHGEICVALRRHKFRPGVLELLVTDNGVGFVQHSRDQAQLGKRLLASLAAQIRGDLSYARMNGLTMARLDFPMHGASPGPDDKVPDDPIHAEHPAPDGELGAPPSLHRVQASTT